MMNVDNMDEFLAEIKELTKGSWTERQWKKIEKEARRDSNKTMTAGKVWNCVAIASITSIMILFFALIIPLVFK